MLYNPILLLQLGGLSSRVLTNELKYAIITTYSGGWVQNFLINKSAWYKARNQQDFTILNMDAEYPSVDHDSQFRESQKVRS